MRMLNEMDQGAIELEMERMVSGGWNKPRSSYKRLAAEANNDITDLMAPMVTWINGYIKGFKSLSIPLSSSAWVLQVLARTIPQKSTE